VERKALAECRLIDTFGTEAQFHNALVLPYERLPRANIGYLGGADSAETGIDYGFIHLNDLTCAGLERNNIVPIREENWRNSEAYRDRFLIVGTPAHGVDAPRIGPAGRPVLRRINAAVIALQPEPNPPAVLVKPFNRWYGRVPGTISIGGMSGCLLLGMKTGAQTSYKPIGVQSGWAEENRITAICPLDVFASWVQEQLRKLAEQENQNPLNRS
jgi:hypothetical protein